MKKGTRKRKCREELSDTVHGDSDADEGATPVAGRKIAGRRRAIKKPSKGKAHQRYTDDGGSETDEEADGEPRAKVVSPVAARKVAGQRRAAKKPSKAKARQAKRSEDAEGKEDQGGDGEETPRAHYTRGKWTNESKKTCEEFGAKVRADVEVMANGWNKSPHQVMMRAGLGMQLSHRESRWSKYVTWYADHHPITSGSM